jgi:ABC-type transport system involved in multi-copper enzyme maturation permease subunit
MTGLLRLEGAGVVRERWFAASLILAAGMVAFFALLASRESAVLAFTGFDRVLTGTGLAALVFLPLLALFSTSQVLPAARQRGVLEWYLSHPLSRGACFWSFFLPRLLAVCAPIAGSVVALGVLAAALGLPVPIGAIARFFALLVGQGFCFAAIGIALGALARSPEQALLAAVGVWMGAVALVDFALIGVLLRWRLPPEAVFALSGINPVQAARLGLLVGGDPDLGLLGPVGTWIVLHLGPTATLGYALAWPVSLGLVALGVGYAAFVRRDAS